jgi:hypothetical protein
MSSVSGEEFSNTVATQTLLPPVIGDWTPHGIRTVSTAPVLLHHLVNQERYQMVTAGALPNDQDRLEAGAGQKEESERLSIARILLQTIQRSSHPVAEFG